MPLQCAIICLDTSEHMRNGDFFPTRLEAQYDAVNMLAGVILNDNPESTAGLAVHGGDRVEVKQSPTDDQGTLLASLHGIKSGGTGDLLKCIKIAMLALKHRKNKNGSKRIIIFVGSPVEYPTLKLKKQAAKLKKNNVILDIISIGESADNREKLQTMVDAAGDQSHLVEIPVGSYPTDILASSPIMGGAGGAAAGRFAGGVDSHADPEMATAIQASLAAARQAAGEDGAGEGGGQAPHGGTADDDELQRALAASMAMMGGGGGEDDMDAELAAAIAASMAPAGGDDAEASPAGDATLADPSTVQQGAGHAEDAGDAGSSEQDAAAAPAPAPDAAEPEGASTAFAGIEDPAFMASLLGGLPGVDLDNPEIQQAMASVAAAAGQQAEQVAEGKGDDEDEEQEGGDEEGKGK